MQLFRFFSIVFILIELFTSDAFPQSAGTDSLAVVPIPLSEIALNAAEDIGDVRDVLEKSVQNDQIFGTRPEIDTLEYQTAKLQELSDQLLQNKISYQYFRSLILRWSDLEKTIQNPISSLKSYSTSIEEILNSYKSSKDTWEATRAHIDEADLSSDLAQRIADVMHFIDSASAIVKDSLAVSVKLLNRATDLTLISSEYIERLEDLQQMEISNLILQSEKPLWKLKPDRFLVSDPNEKALLHFSMEDSKKYLVKEWKTLTLLFITFILLYFFLAWLQKIHVNDKDLDDPHASIRKYILSKPGTTSLMLTLLLSLWWLPERPALLTQIYQVIFIAPFVLLLRGLVIKSFRSGIHYLIVLLLFEISMNFYQLGALAGTMFNLVESALVAIVLFWMIKISRHLDSKYTTDIFLTRFFSKAGPVYFLGVSAAFFSAVFGYYNFAGFLNYGVIFSLLIALFLGVAFLCIITLIYFFIQTSYADKSLIVKEKKRNLFNWLRKMLRLAVFLVWVYFTLKAFYLWKPFSSVVEAVWHTGYQFGSVNLTIGGILSFALIIYLSWLVSYMIRMLLEVEIFGRFDLPRGIPMAISSLTQYFLIVLGFMLAMSKLGFDLKNLSLLAGALGVGIGFGLQNTVNNFISGLILAFERPVTVGDIVNVAGHEGEVKKIGIRSSTIRQWDGSEVIVPNAELISQKVINWTLTKYTRRLILTVHTHLDTDPEQVLKLLTDAAGKVVHVLPDPPMKAYFHGIQDKHLEFALYYWAAGNILDCKSLVNLEVQKVLKTAGIKFQMPIPLKFDGPELPVRDSGE